jgi:hypothetical protein
MPRRSWLAPAILVTAGIVILLGGLAAVAMGLVNPTLLRGQLPPEAEVDAAAVGGAAVALGVATALVGLLHLVTAAALRRGVGIAATAAVVLAATMAVISLGFAVAALVSMASGAALAVYMLPASVGLGAAVIGYAIVTVIVIGDRHELV